MDIEKLAERCMVAESCLPDAPYRTQLCKLHQEMLGEIARLRAEVEALRVDAERYRYIRRKVCIIERGGFMGTADDKYSVFELINMPQPTHIAPDSAIELDAAIDAARGKDNG
jgi:hypothetical protein